MLDVHALAITPGAATVLGTPGTVAPGDGGQTPGVPIGPGAVLRLWGYQSLTADTIGAVKLTSQDMVDAVDGITVTPGAASLLLQYYDYTTLPYVSGTRLITAGTNTGVTAGTGILIDEYSNRGQCVAGSYAMPNVVCVGATTFGGALTKGAWGTMAYAAPNLPAGKYAILGVYVSAISNVATIRFTHNDFMGVHPGFMVSNWEIGLVATEQTAMRDELVRTAHGEQFIYLSEIFGRPQCPAFTVSNAGTGLVIEMLSEVADTPVVNLVLAKVG